MAETTPAVSDEAKRIMNAMTMHAVAGSFGWVAFHLADGRPADHVPYEHRTDAVRAMKWDRDNFIYLEIKPGGMSLGEAEAVLGFARSLHDAGFRIPDPEFDFDPVMPYRPADRAAKIAHLASGGKFYPKGF